MTHDFVKKEMVVERGMVTLGEQDGEAQVLSPVPLMDLLALFLVPKVELLILSLAPLMAILKLSLTA